MKRVLLALAAMLLLVLPAVPEGHPTASAFVIIRYLAMAGLMWS